MTDAALTDTQAIPITSQAVTATKDIPVGMIKTTVTRSDDRTNLEEASQTMESKRSPLDIIFLCEAPEDSCFNDFREEFISFSRQRRSHKRRRDSQNAWVPYLQAEMKSQQRHLTKGRSLYGAQWGLEMNDGGHYEQKLYETYHHVE